MQLDGVRQVGATDGVARGPDRRHHLVGLTLAVPVLLLTANFGRCDSGNRHYSKVSTCSHSKSVLALTSSLVAAWIQVLVRVHQSQNLGIC